MIVADSDVLIDALNGREPVAGRIREALEADALATTTISAFELLSGARSDKQERAVNALLAAMPHYPFDDESSRTAASLRRRLESEGRTIGMADYLIAGICITRGASLLTRNRKHFDRIESLSLSTLDPVDEE